jgi:hypothetical protein
MRRQTQVRLCLVLFILAATVSLTVLPAHNAYAVPCCGACDGAYENCVAGVIYTWCAGDPLCCDREVYNRCWRWCNPYC